MFVSVKHIVYNVYVTCFQVQSHFHPKIDLKRTLFRTLFNQLLCSWTLAAAALAVHSCTSVQ